MSAWRVLGTMTGMMAAFAGVFALAFTVTRGSIWMLAFFPLFLAVPGAVLILGFPDLHK